MKTSTSKGFTLIELMVVIAIIALLSSVVLASLKGAREKAVLAKTVGEMKSLQQAVELHKNQFARYPDSSDFDNGIGIYSDDTAGLYGGFDTLMQTALVDNKLISKVPHAPNYPNNCTPPTCLGPNDYYLMYSPFGGTLCGGNKVDNYNLALITSKKINLPLLSYFDFGAEEYLYFGSGQPVDQPATPPYFYCLAG